MSKNARLYALIGLFVLGGLIVPSYKTARADDNWSGCDNIGSLSGSGVPGNLCGTGGYELPTFPNTLYGVSWIPQSLDFEGTTPDDITFQVYISDPSPELVYSFTYPKETLVIDELTFIEFPEPLTINPEDIGEEGYITIQHNSNAYVAMHRVDNGFPYAVWHWEELETTTRIIDIIPAHQSVIDIGGAATGTVDFSLHAYINPDDLGNFLTIKIQFQNRDQNTLLSSPCTTFSVPGIDCSIYSFTIFSGNATTSGDFYYSSSTILAKGNYRVTASLDTATVFLGVNLGAFTFLGAVSDSLTHQFIVGSSTWIGNISQNIFEDVNTFFGTLPATTTAAMAGTCVPFSSSFGIMECMSFLFIPEAEKLEETLENFKTGVLTRVPWGYATRFFAIMSGTATTSLPGISYEFDPNGPLSGVVWEIDIDDMIAGAGTVLEGVTDSNGNNIRDVLEPLVYLLVAIAVIFGIVIDITGSHGGSVHNDRNKKR